jgi:CRP-like cAMP-binding protein
MTMQSICLLHELPGDVRAALNSSFSYHNWRLGDLIATAGERPDRLHFLLSGHATVFQSTPGGRWVIIDEFGPGACIGDFGLQAGVRSSATLMSDTNTTTASITVPSFWALVAMRPDLLLAMVRRLSAALTEAHRRVVALSTQPAARRVCDEILRLGQCHGRLEEGRIMVPALPVHERIAARAGTSRETVARTVSRLQQCGALERTKCGVVVDAALLKDVAAESSGGAA